MSPSEKNQSTNWRQLYPFESHWHEPGSGYGRMHYLDEGPLDSFNGHHSETLLFVHGNPTWSFHWRRLITSLRDRYRCIAPDHIGCGLSDKPQRFLTLDNHIENLGHVIENLKLDRVTLIAQDWGGAIGLGAMLRMRHRLERIMLFNTGAFPPRYIPWRIRACRIPLIGRLAVQGANAFSRAALRMTLARRPRLAPDVEAAYMAPYDSWANRCAIYGFVKDIPNPRRPLFPDLVIDPFPEDSTWGRLAVIEQSLSSLADRPSCLIWGMRDWCFRPDCLERFLEAWPQAEVHRLADVGHWVVEDAPEESLALVERFLGCQLSAVGSQPYTLRRQPKADSGQR
ncbi:MAG TPA: alpha/beta fold hydrolase [Lacipirellulaceae bacterium]|jgi:haloalkane dehalogenase|nr:alpha/beta fold hydrolase [Lacipirellulaceae bacterium]